MSSRYNSIFSEGIDRHEGIEYNAVPVKANRIFHSDNTKKRFFDAINWETPGRPQLRRPGEPHHPTPFAQSFGLHATIVMYGAMDSVPKEDIDDDIAGVLHKLIPAMGGGFGRSFRTNEEQVSAEFFINNYATGTGKATVDGVSLFSTVHPLSYSQSGTTFSNRPSVDGDISIAMADFYVTTLATQYAANGNEFLDNAPRLYVCHPSQKRIARQVWETQWERNSANLNQNVIADENVEVMTWNYFQKSGATGTNNAGFVVGKMHNLFKIMRERFSSDSDFDIGTRSVIVVADSRFLITCTDPRGTAGSVGA